MRNAARRFISGRALRRRLAGWVGAMAVGFGLLVNSAGAWAGGRAVSALSGKADLGTGISNGTGVGLLSGSLTAPVGSSLGLQLDGAGGKREPQTGTGTGAHLFWRDPVAGLAGIAVERIWLGSTFLDRIGAEAELYEPHWTLAGAAGYQNGFVPHSAYTKLDLRFYVTGDLMLSAGVHQSGGRYIGRTGVEWQAGTIDNLGGLTLFADAGVGTRDNDFVLAGVRFYFGADKSLIRRHREDDPPNSLGDDLLENAGFLHSSSPTDAGSSGASGGSGGGPPPPPPPEF